MQSIGVTYHESYCGGARPSDEMLAEIQKAKPYINQTLILIPPKGKALKVKTDFSGIFRIKLKDGTYKVKEAWRFNKSTPNGKPSSHFDNECLKSEWEKVAMELTIKSGKPNLALVNDIIIPCDWAIPCLQEAHRPPVAE